jgi:hypothetical protein
MARSILVVCMVPLGALIAIGATTTNTPAHAVAYSTQMPEGLCSAYSTYLAKGHAPIELAELVCPFA